MKGAVRQSARWQAGRPQNGDRYGSGYSCSLEGALTSEQLSEESEARAGESDMGEQTKRSNCVLPYREVMYVPIVSGGDRGVGGALLAPTAFVVADCLY